MTFRRALAAVQMSAVRITFQRKALNDDRLGDANLNEPCLAKKTSLGSKCGRYLHVNMNVLEYERP